MNLYFVASPRAVVERKAFFKSIYNHLAKSYKMLSDLVVTIDEDNVKEFYGADQKTRIEHFKRTMLAVKQSDLVVVEASLHSMSMGFIVNKALELGRPVVVLYRKGVDPYFFSGIEHERLFLVEYEDENINSKLDKALVEASGLMDVRFNFFVSPKILEYLDWVAKKRMIPRAVFLRELIEKEMKKDKGFGQE